MRLSVLQQDLLPFLQSVARSIGIRSTLPVLDNILLSAEGQKLKIAATNLEIGVIKYLNVEVEIPGSITVPAKTLVELVSGLGQNKISLELKGEILTVESGKFKATINGIAAAEFPAIPLSSSSGISLPKEAFLTSSQILFASAVDEGRPVLTGILTDISANKLDFVATDGFRLAHRRLELPKGNVQFKSLIPRKTFEEVLRLMAEEQDLEEVGIATSENQNQIVFSLGSTQVSSRLIEGQFPAWSKIIPQKIIARAAVTKEEFLKAIKLAAIFAKNEANIVILTTKKGFLKLESHTKEVGSQENEIEGDVEGDELTIAFNTKFLMDAISNSPSTQVLMEFSGPLSAALIKPIGVEGLEYIVMPVRLN
ncbi:MAG: DNA polymerase III subunit beta [Candidatus Daviesbacteria bacterium]|nr:DNA polymerase III subunit beta [Candidatus Daviesbacteria bacterium]